VESHDCFSKTAHQRVGTGDGGLTHDCYPTHVTKKHGHATVMESVAKPECLDLVFYYQGVKSGPASGTPCATVKSPFLACRAFFAVLARAYSIPMRYSDFQCAEPSQRAAGCPIKVHKLQPMPQLLSLACTQNVTNWLNSFHHHRDHQSLMPDKTGLNLP